MQWLEDTPLDVVNGCLVMLPRLRASEQLASIHVGAIAAGTMAEDDRNRLMRGLELIANGGTTPKRRMPQGLPMTPEAAASLGFTVQIVERKA